MTPAQANAEAPHWLGLARALARRHPAPPLYSREDWEAEAYLGLAVALRDLETDGRRPRATYAPFIRMAVMRHLAKARRAVNSAASDGPTRATLASAVSMDERKAQVEDEGMLSRHDTVPGPSPDPAQALDEAALMGAIRTLALSLSPDYRRALGFLLRGTPPSEVAALTGETPGAVSNRRMRVRRVLAATLEPLGYSC